MDEGDKEMRDNYKGISIAQNSFIKRAGGIAFFTALAFLTCLLSVTPAGAELESQCRLVQPGKCAECHPNNPNQSPGKCNLIADHQDRWDCVSCHSTCVDEGPPPGFDHFADVCAGCHRHPLDYVHNKHTKKNGPGCNACHTGKEILIAVDSKHGTTAAYAEILANELCANGFQVDVALAHKNLETYISGYDADVIGSPTYGGSP